MNRGFILLISLFCLPIFGAYSQVLSPLNPFNNFFQSLNTTATIEGRVYQDDNGNGIQDAGENGIENVIVIIVDDNTSGFTTSTDANGDWSFDVIPGNTLILINSTTLPAGSVQTEGTEPTIVTAVDNATVDAGTDGYAIFGELNGLVYFDVNGNGTQDAGENGIPNVDVQIDDAFGNSFNVVTDANGEWNTDVLAGNVNSTIDESDPDFPTGAIQTEGTNPTTTAITGGAIFSETDGFFESGELNGRLYLDTNGNGTQDAGENGIANVDIQIDNALGATQTITTDANGDWSIQVPAGATTSTIDESDPDFPTGTVQTEGTNPTTTVVANDEVFSETDGYFQFGTLTGRLYFDVNGNGTQDTGENGIANVDVQIVDALGDSQIIVTDANGDWSVDVPVGDTTSTIDESDPDFPTGAQQTEGTNPTTTVVTAGDTFNEIDGFFESGELSGRLYLDANGDGVQNTGENGIPNVDVQIDDALGVTQTVVTDANGDWSFQAPVGNVTTTIDEADPDFPQGTSQTEGTNPTTTTITNAGVFSETDGYFQFGTLTGRVYFDVNGNGTQETGENGIPNVDVQIVDALGDSQIIVTDANGDWTVDVPVGNTTSTIDESDPDFPTGAQQTEGTNPTTTVVTAGDTFNEVDGFFESGELSGRLYHDVNGNGTQDTGESGLPNVDVQIDDALGNTQTVVTDVNGDWFFQAPVGNVTTTIDESDPDFPSAALQTEGTNPTTTFITNGDTFSEVDGFFESGELSGRLYFDVNGNGIQDAGENGISDVDVQIDNALGNTETAITDANGDWSIQVPIGNTTSAIDESDPDFPTGAVQTEGTNPTTTLVTIGNTFNEVDGFFESGDITGRLYLDDNGNGTQDTGENGIANVDVQLEDAFGNTQIVVTNANGDWNAQVPVGNFTSTIDVFDPDFPTGAIQTEGTNPTTTLITIASNFSENDGFFVLDPTETGTLTGHIYLDDNGNATQDAGEADLANLDVVITDSQNNTQTVSTDANGDWSVVVPTGNTESNI
ncbi:beta strand repeat-containing protein, partial [Flavobacteriaceae bacterium 14752]|uniref:beta strand repeat-containing protein n=1 Tax=Mesohalobacter salilacus TaxID=2491711 RepID=UPI000F6356F4